MNTRKTEKTTNSRLFNKGTLAAAVATIVAGTSFATGGNNQWVLGQNSTITSANIHGGTNATIDSGDLSLLGTTLSYSSGTSVGNATTDYLLSDNTTLIFASNNTIHYGNVDAWGGGDKAHEVTGSWRLPNVIVSGNLTMLGNVGSANTTGNWTINSGNTLTIASNASSNTFTTNNITLEQHTVLNTGNSTAGYFRSSADALTINSNITMYGNSTINIGNGTTINGSIFGASGGVGTLNILGNFTSGGALGGMLTNGGDSTATGNFSSVEQINVSLGNTLTLNHNANATRMNINGTVTALGNITSDITMGANGILNLDTSTTSNSASNVTGTIDGYDAQQGTLNINGTFTTVGAIGSTYGLAAINLDVNNNATSLQGNTVKFTKNVNATTITIGISTSNQNATLQIGDGGLSGTKGVNVNITGNIIGGGNATSTDNAAGGIFLVSGNATVNGSIGTSDNILAAIQIEDGTTLTISGADRNIYANNITMKANNNLLADNATLAFNGTGTTTVNGVIAGTVGGGEGLIDINTGTVSFKNTVGSASNYIGGIDVADGSTMTTSSNIYANSTIKVRGTLNIDATGGITIAVNDANGDGGGLQIGNTSGDNGTLETAGTVTLSSSTITTATGGATASFNNALL